MTSDETLDRLLNATGMFQGLPGELRASVAQRFAEAAYARGALIFGRGDPGDFMLLVAKGRVQLTVATEDGRELTVRTAESGALLGEIAVMDGSVRSADATAVTAVTGYILRRRQVEQLLEEHPAFARNVIAFLCRRLRETTDQLEGIALLRIEERLARFLLASLGGRTAPPGKRVALDLALSQSELALMLGASRPKVNVALGVLEKAGAVKRTVDRLFCDPEILRRLAGADGHA